MRLYWTSSHLTEPTQSNTKRSVDFSTMYSHSFNAMSLCICNALRHCMLYHDTCIMNATWTTQSIPLTGCHGQSHHLHMTSIYHFIHVNISCKHISTSTYNMSLYVQVMTHTQSSHVMTICTYKLITCQYIKTHILTSKHVTLSQAMTLLNKSYNGLETSNKQSQTRLRDQPQIGHKHRPHAAIGLPRPHLGGLESSHFPSSGLPRRTLPCLGGLLCLGEHHLRLSEGFFFLETPCPRLGKGCSTGTRTSNQFLAQKWKINQVGRILYLLECRKIPKKPRGHLLNLKPSISQTPHLDPRQNLTFSIHTSISLRNELSFLARQTSIDGNP